MTQASSSIGSRSMTGRRRHGLGWVPWLAFGLLALLALLSWLVISNVDDDDASTATNQAATGQSANDQSATAAGGGVGALTSNGQTLTAASLAGAVGQPVDGRRVRVESVVADEGFWVGSSAADRVFIFLTPEARATTGESPFQVTAGQSINLVGSVKPIPADLTPFGVEESEGAAQLRSQGHYVEATRVELSN